MCDCGSTCTNCPYQNETYQRHLCSLLETNWLPQKVRYMICYCPISHQHHRHRVKEMGRKSHKTEMKAVQSEEKSLLDYAVDFLKSLILLQAHLQTGMWAVLQMDGDAHQEKHTHISCGLIFLFASSGRPGRFIWKDGNEGGEALVRPQFLFPICYSPFFSS